MIALLGGYTVLPHYREVLRAPADAAPFDIEYGPIAAVENLDGDELARLEEDLDLTEKRASEGFAMMRERIARQRSVLHLKTLLPAYIVGDRECERCGTRDGVSHWHDAAWCAAVSKGQPCGGWLCESCAEDQAQQGSPR
jgi:hypothetical protein